MRLIPHPWYQSSGETVTVAQPILGDLTVQAWKEREIERARKLTPKIRNGRHHSPMSSIFAACREEKAAPFIPSETRRT